MSIKRMVHLTSVTVCMAGMVHLSGCGSVRKPAVADGSSRVSANAPDRIQALQERVASDRALVTENNLLRLQVDVLQRKLTEMTAIVKEALLLPPAASAQPPFGRSQSVPLSPVSPAPAAGPSITKSSEQSLPAPVVQGTSSLPASVVTSNGASAVIRVFHGFAKTDFEPSESVAKVLRNTLRDADTVEVRGHTDSNVVNPVDKQIAIERAEKARTWLIANGADPLKVGMQYFAAGHFLTENRTAEGRAHNRRVEIEIRNAHLVGSALKCNGTEDQ